jgi:hypothetical protein
MTRSFLVAGLALAIASCEDKPTTAPNNRTWHGLGGPTAVLGPNDPTPGRPYKPLPAPLPPIGPTFDGHVLEKHPGGFVFKGLSGKKYLLVPSRRLIDLDPGLPAINYDQIQVGQKLRVHLSWKILHTSVYLCDGVFLHGVKRRDGTDPYKGLPDRYDPRAIPRRCESRNPRGEPHGHC